MLRENWLYISGIVRRAIEIDLKFWHTCLVCKSATKEVQQQTFHLIDEHMSGPAATGERQCRHGERTTPGEQAHTKRHHEHVDSGHPSCRWHPLAFIWFSWEPNVCTFQWIQVVRNWWILFRQSSLWWIAQSEQPSPLHAVITVKSRTMKDHEPWSEGQEGEWIMWRHGGLDLFTKSTWGGVLIVQGVGFSLSNGRFASCQRLFGAASEFPGSRPANTTAEAVMDAAGQLQKHLRLDSCFMRPWGSFIITQSCVWRFCLHRRPGSR